MFFYELDRRMDDRRFVCHVDNEFGQQNDESRKLDAVVNRHLPLAL